jgi:hypothetical protein
MEKEVRMVRIVQMLQMVQVMRARRLNSPPPRRPEKVPGTVVFLEALTPADLSGTANSICEEAALSGALFVARVYSRNCTPSRRRPPASQVTAKANTTARQKPTAKLLPSSA